MKLFALAAAGLIAIGSIAAAPADAQPRRGWSDGRGYDDGRWDRGQGWDSGRGWDRGRDRGWDRGGYGWQGDRGWRGNSRVRCRVVRGYYGPERRCFRVWR